MVCDNAKVHLFSTFLYFKPTKTLFDNDLSGKKDEFKNCAGPDRIKCQNSIIRIKL